MNNKSLLVSLTFDDGWKSHIQNAVPILHEYGVTGTFYIISDRLDDRLYPMYMNVSDIKFLSHNDHEIGSHTRSHKHLLQLSNEDAWDEILKGKKDLEKLDIMPTSFAYPFGEWNPDIVKLVREAGFSTARSIVDGYNRSDTDPLLLRCVHVVEKTTIEQIEHAVEMAQKQDSWLILMFHQIESAQILRENGMIYGTTPDLLSSILTHLQESQARVLTVEEAMRVMVSRSISSLDLVAEAAD